MKKLLTLLLLFLSLLTLALSEEDAPSVINLVKDPNAEYQFQRGAPLLEIVFPRVFSSDCAIIRYGDEVIMIDASTKNAKMRARIKTACEAMGVDHIDIAYNSHPHDDHIDGFQYVWEYAPFDQFIITFPEDFNSRMEEAVAFMREKNVPILSMGDGDVITLGGGAVKMTIIQQRKESWPVNDQSAMLMIEYGERRILFAGDNENRSQAYQLENPPAVGLKADIFKYPHHGQVKLNNNWIKAIDPELVFMNGASSAVKGGEKYCKQRKLDYLIGFNGLTRMRTDGKIWVVDYLEEPGADRKLPFTPARDNEYGDEEGLLIVTEE